jgi:hypothetical protein
VTRRARKQARAKWWASLSVEDLIVQLDATFSDLEAAKTKGYLARDMPILHKTADGIRERREAIKKARRRK